MAGAVAGTIIAEEAPPNDNWRRCDGSYILNVNFNDYWRRVMFRHGGGWIGGMRLPLQAGSIIAVRDDPDYPADTTPPVNVDVPAVLQDGDTLSCTTGNWDGTPTSYSYRWQIDGIDAPGDGATLTVVAGDVGEAAVCIVTATNAAGSTAAPPSVPLVIGAID